MKGKVRVMAQKVQVVLTCDLDDEEVPAAETVTFGYDGYTYAFELCERHLEEFHETIGGYIAAARVADGPRRRRRRSQASAPAASPSPSKSAGLASVSEIRTWARDNGYVVSDRGRISAEVRAAYDEAH